ncbi:MAG: molybdate ABC transporter substrate-binding protein [Rhodobacteraceae bacterium]|nr:molybdate ABC transporter substrate-binding protein [Paracoccaceae bacterium]
MNPARRAVLLAALAGAASAALRPPGARAGEAAPAIAAASDLKFALEEIAAAFTAETGQRVRLSFGSTGTFATQIRQGAPFEMFMAADQSFVEGLHAAGLTRDEGTLYAEGRIVLIAPHGSPLRPDPALDGLADLLGAGRITRFALANPEHAPYGLRGQEALQHRGLWEAIRPFLVLGENVSQAAQFALSGNAEGGIVALSLASAPDVAARGTFALIPRDWHEPLLQRMVLLRGAGPVAEAFYAHVQGPGARAILARYGFTLPGAA